MHGLRLAPRLEAPSFVFQSASVVDGMVAVESGDWAPLLQTRQCVEAPTLAFVQALQATLPMIALASLRQPLDFLDSAELFQAEQLLPARQQELWATAVEPALNRFLHQVEALQPCGAYYEDPRNTFSPIFCDQPRQNHPVGFHSCDSRRILEYDTSFFAKAMGGFRRRFSRMSKTEREQARTSTRHANWPTAEPEGRWARSKTVDLPSREDLMSEARRRYDMVFEVLRDPGQRRGLTVEHILGVAQSMLCDWAFTCQEPLAFQVWCQSQSQKSR
jgi:hypothetical protein